MSYDKSKSFSSPHFGSGERKSSHNAPPVRGDNYTNGNAGLHLGDLLNRIFLVLQKLFVALKYQFLKKNGFEMPVFSIPWFKLSFLALTAFIVFKKDLSFSVNMNGPGAEQAEMSYSGLAGAVAQPTSLKTAGANPFADQPGDTDKDRLVKSYVRRFQKIAVQEMKKFGIPASVKMAQAIIESNAGTSLLSTKNNNHFGIKCFSKKCGKNHCSNFGDDHHKDFFRKYDNAWESWRSHSKMIVGGRYKELLKYGTDYAAWAKGLKKLGYATDKRYAEKIIETIETYHLYVLDAM